MKICIFVDYCENFWLNNFFQNFCKEYYWCYLDAVFNHPVEFNSLHKKDIQHFYIGPIFSQNKIIRSAEN